MVVVAWLVLTEHFGFTVVDIKPELSQNMYDIILNDHLLLEHKRSPIRLGADILQYYGGIVAIYLLNRRLIVW